jgi:integrase
VSGENAKDNKGEEKTERFGRYLEGADLLPSTRDKYQRIFAGSDTDLVSWIHDRAKEKRIPVGTLLPARGAVKHYLVGVLGYNPDVAEALLPPARGRRPTRATKPLTAEQLALYHAAVEQIPVEPARTILQLLPTTGMKIGELCDLRRKDLQRVGDSTGFRFWSNVGKERVVPLSLAARRVLFPYLEEYNPADYLFPHHIIGDRQSVEAIPPWSIRLHTRALGDRHPELKGLTTHALRVTAATLWLAAGTPPETVQSILGHQFNQTTRRYGVKGWSKKTVNPFQELPTPDSTTWVEPEERRTSAGRMAEARILARRRKAT